MKCKRFFGQEQYVFIPGSDTEPEIRRAPNGAWNGIHGPQYTRVSAVWIFNDLQVSSLAGRRSTLYFNPWAVRHAPESMKCFPFAFPEENMMQQNRGFSFREIFGLHKAWPEKE
jgi:hypothetical protein